MSWEEDARRVAEIFGVPAGHRLPAVSRQTLRHYRSCAANFTVTSGFLKG
jgi:hypothetical protein